MSDTENMPLDGRHKNRVNFDPTINLGHILTFAAALGGGALGYFDLRERIGAAEHRTVAIGRELDQEKTRIREALTDLRDDMREVRRGVDELGRRKP